ncbi:hypothetical protein L873DRAFT_1812512 [Choiromyces venosus 120613-1]|uniref:Zn(2)-C6 fungal-type domain-containing protein n=1 Tax=Choiromyces venosus 120613-1 TaxID=1336337 RepID=A0A3N4JGA9_9PEZI|nr:hypothetical protein L873DRAFT_1812512 [Choiromyces venosus 120613-1]
MSDKTNSRQLPQQRFSDSGQTAGPYPTSLDAEIHPLPSASLYSLQRYILPRSGPGSYHRGDTYPNIFPNLSTEHSQSSTQGASGSDEDAWWSQVSQVSQARFSNSNDFLNSQNSQEHGNLWSQYRWSGNAGERLSENPLVVEGGNYREFPAERLQGLDPYGEDLGGIDPHLNLPSTEVKKTSPQAPLQVYHSINVVPSQTYTPPSSFDPSPTFTAPLSPPTPSVVPGSSSSDSPPELTISPEPPLRRIVLRRGFPLYQHFMVPARSRKGCWTCRRRKVKCDETTPVCKHCARLGYTCDYTPRYTYKDDSPAKSLESITDLSGNPNPLKFLGNEWNPRYGPRHLPEYKFAECIRDADREMLAAQHKPGSFFVITTCDTFEETTRNIYPRIPTCYYSVGLLHGRPLTTTPVSVMIREYYRNDTGFSPDWLRFAKG